MDIVWYEREEVKDRLTVFGRAIQGIDPYEVVLEPDPAKCHGGCCSFAARRITVNPLLFSVPAREQYQLTKALLVHEAGHRRYTLLPVLPEPIQEITNILEDERVERRMCREFVGIRWLIDKLAKQFYEEARSISKTSNSPSEVVCYFLQLRWAIRIGQPVKGSLSLRNQLLWRKIEPLVYDAWQADCSGIVSRNAIKIAETLELCNKGLGWRIITSNTKPLISNKEVV